MAQKRHKHSDDKKREENPGHQQMFVRAQGKEAPTFTVRCEPETSGTGEEVRRRLSVFVGQRVRSHSVEQPWDTILIFCEEDTEGTLSTRIVISNPDWEERVQIAQIRSRPQDENALAALGCNLDHQRVAG